MSLAVFALVVLIWVVLLVPLARRGRAELAAEATAKGLRLSSGGARPWTTGNLAADSEPELDPDTDELAAAAARARLARRRAAARRVAVRRRRVLLVLVVAAAGGLRAWVVLGGRWWLAAAVAGGLLGGYLLTLVVLGWRQARRRRQLAGLLDLRARAARWADAPWGGPLAPSTE